MRLATHDSVRTVVHVIAEPKGLNSTECGRAANSFPWSWEIPGPTVSRVVPLCKLCAKHLADRGGE